MHNVTPADKHKLISYRDFSSGGILAVSQDKWRIKSIVLEYIENNFPYSAKETHHWYKNVYSHTDDAHACESTLRPSL